MSLAEYPSLCLGLRHTEEKPAKPRVLRALRSVSDRAVAAPAREAQRAPLFAHFRAASRRSIAAAIARARSSSSRRRLDRGARRTPRRAPASGPGREPDARRRRAARRSRRRAGRARTPRPSRPCSRGRVPSRAIRAGHALRAIAVADRRGPALDELGHAGLRPEARELARGPRHRAGPGFHLHHLRRLEPAAPSAWVAVITACPMPATRSASTSRRRGVELREDVVEQQQRRREAAAPPRRAAARAPRAAARPASRSCAGRGRR